MCIPVFKAAMFCLHPMKKKNVLKKEIKQTVKAYFHVDTDIILRLCIKILLLNAYTDEYNLFEVFGKEVFLYFKHGILKSNHILQY
jgi:hypothetical protein